MKPEELAEHLRQRLEELVTFFGVNATATVTASPEAIELSLDSDSSGRLIGHRGETLHALEYLMNMFARHESSESPRVHVDIAGYRAARAEALTAMAKAVAEKVTASGSPEELKPMNPAERRIVHMALAVIPEVTTESRGEGLKRHIVVLPRS